MYYNGYNYKECECQQHYHHYNNRHNCYNSNDCMCYIYPIPFMPANPLYAHAYVPYQTYTTTYPIGEALKIGTLFPELSNVYNPYADYWKGEK